MGEWEAQYAQQFEEVVQKARSIEAAWLKMDQAKHENLIRAHPSCVISSFDYRAMGWKTTFTMGCAPCPRCQGKNIGYQCISAGCRKNGDGYGSQLYYCEDCGCHDWVSYDEA